MKVSNMLETDDHNRDVDGSIGPRAVIYLCCLTYCISAVTDPGVQVH